ncbi:hypothetical protein TTHERM_01609740 (macronuclear) [Tetrahymena thermophila SB210]|uniref:Uncharacterized protein n=1 Tax=Tetrahymena thermophila (strain SB210) TaxID=312017 RepID=Q228B2_TETTS|nr:hypothetical protein TTHERM_01609740 [Tetrahymena thermophila SB210]EAR81628.1 hypothetical protein TTHERM_01609740 [Tetrahymena thermophila SB210]|eukprot:XP_001029291.1 hypothetical protein TTHERM_01609740 [Tetrahymena thermophila SB210]
MRVKQVRLKLKVQQIEQTQFKVKKESKCVEDHIQQIYYLKIFKNIISFFLPRDKLTHPKELVRLESSQGGLFKKISPHISEDIVEILRDKIWQSYLEKTTSGQPSRLFQQKLLEKREISNQQIQNEQKESLEIVFQNVKLHIPMIKKKNVKLSGFI